MERFRDQQKQMEEANKQKKALLAKTLTERYLYHVNLALGHQHIYCIGEAGRNCPKQPISLTVFYFHMIASF